MSAVSQKLRSSVDGSGRRGLTYWCQGCESVHQIWYEGGPPNQNWGWNKDVDRPVFSPSVLVTHDLWTSPVTPDNLEQWRAAPWTQHQVRHVCHTFVGCNGAQPGEVIFLSDCTHPLAGTVQPFPDLPDYLRGDQ